MEPRRLEGTMMNSHHRNTPADDLKSGILDWPLWVRFGWYDIVSRYRRSWIGPLWLAATTLIFVVALGTVYSILFKVSIKEYMPFVALGTFVWA
jgi:lipopolysaccharide transport system permease protein